ncbi:MAG: hypothetical protein M3P26_11815 [Gemmatimonadota bacterium]|nr:hypothetical protein [Gemmatimonadota bacterium]
MPHRTGKTIPVRTAKGKDYTLVEYDSVIPVGDFGDPNDTLPGLPSYKTTTGLTVNRKSETDFEILEGGELVPARNESDWALLKRIILAWRESGDVVESGIAVRLSGLVDAPLDDRQKWVGKFYPADVTQLQKKALSDRLGGATAVDVERTSEIIADWLRAREQ